MDLNSCWSLISNNSLSPLCRFLAGNSLSGPQLYICSVVSVRSASLLLVSVCWNKWYDNFQSIDCFRASLTNSLLIYQCRINFACVFNLCMRSILYLLYCHITCCLHNIISGQLIDPFVIKDWRWYDGDANCACLSAWVLVCVCSRWVVKSRSRKHRSTL